MAGPMAGVPLDRLPDGPRTAWLALRDELHRILGENLVAMWAHGGTVAVDDPPHAGDLDTYVLLAGPPDPGTAAAIESAQEAISRERGVEWDAWYVLADAARLPEPPRHAFQEGRRDTSWALHRSHWLAGRFALLHGDEPAGLVPAPTAADLRAEMSRELEHIERHVVEGDTDPYEATYAHLTGSRILHALAEGSVVISKRGAGAWALANLPAAWHPALEAALRVYGGHPEPGDAALLAASMPRFVAFVRERLPDPDRAPGSLPRWSGY